MEPATFTFRNRTFVNQVEQDETSGKATLAEESLVVDLDAPDRVTLEIDTPAAFPTRHVADLVVAALAGERIYEADVYDGAEDGSKAFSTTTVIGPRQAGLGDPSPDEADALFEMSDDVAHFRMNMSYFDVAGATGELTPSYELAFILYDNGISRDLTFDYGAFALTAQLVELELIDQPPCE